MAKKRISDLPSKPIPGVDDLIAIVDQQSELPTTKKTTIGRLLDLLNAVTRSLIGAPGGVASLDEQGKIPVEQMPTSLVGATGVAGPRGATGVTGST
ncbi:MAG: hypothetical protein EB121_08825, partial [Alphaproteobacteria bacterium]|nr:hypothetical protein [Alphaproteobacteria bacterium]